MICFSFTHAGTRGSVSEIVRLFCHETFQKVNTKVLSSLPAPSYLAMSRSSAVRSAAVSKLCSSLVQFQFRFFPYQSRNQPFKFNCKELRHVTTKYSVTGNVMEKKQTHKRHEEKKGKKRKNNERK